MKLGTFGRGGSRNAAKSGLAGVGYHSAPATINPVCASVTLGPKL